MERSNAPYWKRVNQGGGKTLRHGNRKGQNVGAVATWGREEKTVEELDKTHESSARAGHLFNSLFLQIGAGG